VSGAQVVSRASIAQEGAYLDACAACAPRFQVHACFDVDGTLDAPGLTRALARLIARHGALRTGLVHAHGRVWQAVAPHVPTPLREVDLRGRADAEQALARLLRAASAPFDAAAPPLLRMLVVRLAPARSRLAIVLDHLIADGWSMRLLLRELSALYAEESGAAPARLAPAHQHADWSAAQRRELTSARVATVARRWRRSLGADPAAAGVALPGLRAGGTPRREAVVQTTIGAPATAALRASAAAHAVSPFVAALAHLLPLLAQEARADAATVVTNQANRASPASATVVGCLTHCGFVHVELGGRPSHDEVVRRVRDAVVNLLLAGHVPLRLLQPAMWPARHHEVRPERRVYVVLNEPWADGLELAGARATRAELPYEQPPRPGLELWIADLGERLALRALHRDADFERAYVERLVERFTTALGDGAAGERSTAATWETVP